MNDGAMTIFIASITGEGGGFSRTIAPFSLIF
jgi:hypothetical protein